MRRLEFKALIVNYSKALDGKWAYLNGVGHDYWTSPDIGGRYYGDIDHRTMCQIVGMQDILHKKVWESDIVKVDRRDSFVSYNEAIVVWAPKHGSFFLQYTRPINPKGYLAENSITSNDKTVLFGSITGWDIEIIGNFYTNKPF